MKCENDKRTSNDIFNKPINGIKECKWCHQKFENISGSALANHIRWCKENPNRGKGLKEKLQLNMEQRQIQKYGKYKEFIVKCSNVKCQKVFSIIEREKKFSEKEKHFCCRSCANSHIISNAQKQKVSKAMRQIAKILKQSNPTEFARCFGLRYNNRRFTSQNERLIRDFIIQKFPLDGWTYGGHLVIDNLGISRDLYSDKLKICFEYDGIWHFKNIHDQLELKQKKDAALEKWCKNNNYRLIRISESWFIEELKKDVNAIIPIIYNTN